VEGELQRIVGRNIRRLRRERGLSQEDLAAEIGVHRTYMGGVERGERNLTLRSLERLAERLGVSPLSLLDGSDSA
jgi:transcriptional regulator with XRE-family HTH domain